MRYYARTAWRLASRSPGPWLVTLSLAVWVLLADRTMLPAFGDPAMIRHHSTAHAHRHNLVDWFAMVLAMAPLVLRNEIAWLRQTNLRRRQGAAIGVFSFGYVIPWLVLGIAWAATPLGHGQAAGPLLVAMLLLCVWHGSPTRQRLLNACHRRPALRVFGWPMITDTAGFGIRSGAICVSVCGPLMLLIMALPHYHVLAMIAATLWLTVERYLPPRRPGWHLPWTVRDRAPRWASYSQFAATS